MQALIDFFGVNDFIPYGYCLAWNPALLWTTVMSNAIMTLAYGSYPIAIAYFIWKRKDLQYRWLYLNFFNGFILTCVAIHLLKVVTVWLPLYWLAAYADALAAMVAVATVFAIWWLIPQALNLLSPAELGVQRSAAQYARSLIEASLDPLVTISPAGKITDVNQATEQATGCSRRKLIGTDFSDYFTEPDKAREGYQQVLREGSVTDYPLTLRHVSGKVSEVLYNASVYRNDKGEAAGVFAAARDITERKRTERELRSASLYARSLIEASLDPLVTISAEGKILDVNDATIKATGVSRDTLLGSDFSEYFTEPDQARAGYQEVFAKGFVTDYPLTLRHASGKVMDVLYNASIYRNDKGEVAGVFAAARDVTDRKRAETELLTASLYARSLIEASLDPLVTISAQGKVTDVNDATIQATGVSRDTLLGSDFSEYFTEPDKARAGYQEVFAKGSVTDYPLTLRHASGKVMDVLYNASLYHNDKGEVAGVFAAARDITARKQAEDRNRHLASIVESSDDAIIGKTLAGVIISWNKGAEKMYGYTASEAVGQPMSLLIPPEHSDELPKILETIRAGKHVEHFETVRRKKDGKDIFVSLSISPIYDADAGIVGASTVARDITERKQAEQELVQLSLRNRLILDSAGEGIYGLDIDGVCTFINPAASQLLGFTVGELIDQHCHAMFHHTKPDGRPYPPEECPVLAAYTQGAVHRGEDIYWRKDGSSFPVEFISTPIREAGKITGAVVAFRDITESKQAAEELRKYHEQLEELVQERTNQLEVANKDLEGFAYSVSHDLRVPLRAIDGFSLQVYKRYADKLDDEGKRYLTVVRDNTKKMSQLIDDILAFSRMGRLGMSMSEINMEELAQVVFEELKPNFTGRELDMQIKPLPVCHGDQAMLRQVWVNLLANAIKFTRQKDAALIEVGGHTEDAEIIYYVKDNGAGFDMQYADKLFGVFQRLHGVEEFEGTGIGLAIVKRIITRHGGRVWAEGQVNEGATFYFALPI